LSRPDSAGSAGETERLDALAQLPRENEGPVFAEPWQAQAFALAVKLSEQGHFTWSEWAAAPGAELKAAVERGEPDYGSHYYEHWLAALERPGDGERPNRPRGACDAQGGLGRCIPAHASRQAGGTRR
jgi:nitrile hydratase accessory protein